MRILVATDNRFWRQALGSHQRIYHMLKFLHNQGHELEIMFVGAPTIDDDRAMRELYFVQIQATQAVMTQINSGTADSPSQLKSALRECLHRLRRMPFEAAYRLRHGGLFQWSSFRLSMREPKLRDFVRPRAIAELNRRLAERLPDVLMVEYLRLTYLVDALPSACRRKLTVLLDTHDVLSERRLRFHNAGQPHDLDVTPAEEAAALAKYDAVIAIQARDAATFKALAPQSTVIVAGHAELRREARHPELAKPRFLFLGSHMKPNLDAARRLALNIWPEINRRLSGKASLSIIGKAGEGLKDLDLAPNIDIKGHVASLADTYRTHNIFLNPVDFGGGLKIKNVEALSHGMALVTTSIGAEGLDTGAGSAFTVANSDQQFIDAACRIATDPALLQSLSDEARKFSARHLGPQSAYGELLTYLAFRTANSELAHEADAGR